MIEKKKYKIHTIGFISFQQYTVHCFISNKISQISILCGGIED